MYLINKLLKLFICSRNVNLSIRLQDDFTLFYDANKNNNVDFIVQRNFESEIPIEVGRGEKKINGKLKMQ